MRAGSSSVLKFLRFVAGENIVSAVTMTLVNFVKMEGFQHRPVVHGCTLLLEVPNSYRNFSTIVEF